MGTIMAPIRLCTLEDFLASPDDGRERWVNRGQLREKVATWRDRFHARLLARIVQLIGNWLDSQPPPLGEVYSGGGVVLSLNPPTVVGIDVTFVSAEVHGRDDRSTTLINRIPTLAVEIVSPNNTLEEIDEKIDLYRESGVALVWIVHSHDQTVSVHRPAQPAERLSISQTLSAEPHLPGFTFPVVRLFQR